jgi:TolB-like protein
MSGLFQEMKRRNVFRVGVAYIVVSWLVAQVADLVLDNIESPDWIIQVLMLVLALGFPFALLFAWAFELTPDGIKKEKDVDRSQSITRQTGRKLDFAIIGVMAVALGYFIYESRFSPPVYEDNVIPERAQRESGTHSEISETAADNAAGEAAALDATSNPDAAATKPDEKSIAVLPFVNMSSDPEQEYFSDGISEEILNALARVKELKVAGRTSSFSFKGQNQDLRTVGQALNVAHILEGSVRKSGNRLRITAQLIKVDDGYHLWSDTYDRELTDVFAIQDEISQAILAQLKAQLIGEELPTAVRVDTRAYELYLLAGQRIYERTLPSLEMGADLLDQAIAIDPSYAPALAQRGIAELLLADDAYGTIPREEAIAQGKALLEKSLELDPELAEGWAGLGLYYNNLPGGHKDSIPVLRRALAINPNMINASNWLQNALQAEGELAARTRILEEMVARDPMYAPGFGNAIDAYASMGQMDRIWALIGRVKPYMPGHPFISEAEARAHMEIGRYAEGLPLAERAVALAPTDQVVRNQLSTGLAATNQYERLDREGTDGFRVFAMTRLDRVEEASILAYELAAQGNIGALFTHLVMTGRFEDLIRFVESRWPDLDAFEADYPGRAGYGSDNIGNIAWSYARTGNDMKFGDAIARMQSALAHQKAQGADNYWLTMSEAYHAMLNGDEDLALALIGKAIDKGYLGDARLSITWPVFESLEGNDRYEAIQARMVERLNAERAELGLAPAGGEETI